MSAQRSTTADGSSTPQHDAPPANPEGPTGGASEHYGEPDAPTRTPSQPAQREDSALPNEAHRHKTPQSVAPVNDYEAALRCVERRLVPVVVGLGTKGMDAKGRATVARGWQKAHIRSVDDVDRSFSPKQRQNIGIKGGEVSGGIVVVDLDDPVAVELAPRFFPPTPTVWGRKGKRASKLMYRVDGGDIYRDFVFPSTSTSERGLGGEDENSMLLELRGASDRYDLIPPSIHPAGDVYQWEGEPFAEPAHIERGKLVMRAGLLAATCLFERAWGEGSRHDLALAVSGLLLKRELDRDTVAEIIETICAQNDDHEVKDRLRALDDTARKLDRDGGEDAVAGVSKLRGLLGEAATDALTSWLNDDGEGKSRATRKHAPRRDGRESVTKRLIEIGLSAELWHDEKHGHPYATFDCGEFSQHLRIKDSECREYLAYRLYKADGSIANPEALRTAVDHLAGLARHDGRARRTWVRRAFDDGAIYIDLCDERWRAVRISRESIEVIIKPPVKFVRRDSLEALPVPDLDGTIEDLERFFSDFGKPRRLNDASARERARERLLLRVGSMVASYRPDFPFPITMFTGEKGSGKSVQLWYWRMLTDPCAAVKGALPRKEDDLIVAAVGEGCYTVDNVSSISPDMADALCRLSTGGGLKKRKLYTDSEQSTLSVKLPVAMTAINRVADRDDFLERVIHIDLPRAGDERRTEAELEAAFMAARPRLFGALCKGVQMALRRLPEVRLPRTPRMLDHVTFVEAAAPAFGWAEGEYLRAYEAMQERLFDAVAEADVFVQRFAEWVHRQPVGDKERTGNDGDKQAGVGVVFEGTMQQLFNAFDTAFEFDPRVEAERRQPNIWPKAPNKLSAKLTEKHGSLVQAGIDFETWHSPKKLAMVRVERVKEHEDAPNEQHVADRRGAEDAIVAAYTKREADAARAGEALMET